MQIPIVIGFFSLIANHPHFMSSYKFAYTRGSGFIFRNWFALIAIPLIFVAAGLLAFTEFNFDLAEKIPSFSFQGQTRLGPLVMMLVIQSMYLTVGWHYAKQVFGVMMTYANFDRYRLSALTRHAIKASVFAVAFLQFIYMARLLETATDGPLLDSRFPAFEMVRMGLPVWFETLAWVVTGATWLSVVSLLAYEYKKTGSKPSLNFLIPWIAFYVWWIPVYQMPEFLILIPFFHAAQYLPFAWKLQHAGGDFRSDRAKTFASVKIFALLIAGFLAFEYVPLFLDESFATDIHQGQWFFTALIPIGINVHHFFMDSVIWKSRDKVVRQALYM